MPETEKKKLTYSGGDYVLASLAFTAHCAVGNLCSYMQQNTPYGTEYQEAFEAYKELMLAMEAFEDKLARTVELRNLLKAKALAKKEGE